MTTTSSLKEPKLNLKEIKRREKKIKKGRILEAEIKIRKDNRKENTYLH